MTEHAKGWLFSFATSIILWVGFIVVFDAAARGQDSVTAFGWVTSSAPSLPDQSLGSLSLETDGDLRVDGTVENSVVWNGTGWDNLFTCPNSTLIGVAAGATGVLVGGTPGTTIRVCSIVVSMSAAGTVRFITGTGVTCGTGTANLTAAMALATGIPIAVSAGNGSLLRAAVGGDLCVQAVTGNATGFISFMQF